MRLRRMIRESQRCSTNSRGEKRRHMLLRRKSASRGDVAKRRVGCAQHLGRRAYSPFQHETIQRIPGAGLHAVKDHAKRQVKRPGDIRAVQAVLDVLRYVLLESGKLRVRNSWLALISSAFSMPRR